MKKVELVILLVMTCIISSFCDVVFGFGHEVTHPAITTNSISMSTLDDYLKNTLKMPSGIQTELQYDLDLYNTLIRNRMEKGNCEPNRTKRRVLDWIKAGSDIEDQDGRTIPIRARHHFHNPLSNEGLDNKYDHPNYSWFINIPFFDVTGQSALTWAIEGEAQQEPYDNFECWGSARYDFHRSFTEPGKSSREEFLAMLFLELGSVMHMIEDMGVPAHTRNDFLFSHLTYDAPATFGNDFENWVERVIKSDGNQCPWSGNSPLAFDKLFKYFDANAYLGDYLGDGNLPPNTWGLSECSNYQFLSLSTMFGCTGTKYQFPNPAKEHLGPLIIEQVPDGKKRYFNGSNYGVSHIARESYTHYYADEHGVYDEEIDNTNTTDDVSVFQTYANITIPRTINYATGLLNYFFRGKLSIEQTDCNNGKIVITITNKSSNSGVNQILKGGTFTLYWDDSSGNRTQVSDFTVYRPGTQPLPGNEWNSTTQMNYDVSTKAVLSPPTTQDVNYILIYEGIISSDPNSLDSDDTRQIATGVQKLCSSCCSTERCNCIFTNDYPTCFPLDKTPSQIYVKFSDVKWSSSGNLIEELNNKDLCLNGTFDHPDFDYSWHTTLIIEDQTWYVWYGTWERAGVVYVEIDVENGPPEESTEIIFSSYNHISTCRYSKVDNNSTDCDYDAGCEGQAEIIFPDITIGERTEWLPDYDYNINDKVYILDNPGYVYICYIAHPSDIPPASYNRPFTGSHWQDYWVEISCN